jgi:hypothetical protein
MKIVVASTPWLSLLSFLSSVTLGESNKMALPIIDVQDCFMEAGVGTDTSVGVATCTAVGEDGSSKAAASGLLTMALTKFRVRIRRPFRFTAVGGNARRRRLNGDNDRNQSTLAAQRHLLWLSQSDVGTLGSAGISVALVSIDRWSGAGHPCKCSSGSGADPQQATSRRRQQHYPRTENRICSIRNPNDTLLHQQTRRCDRSSAGLCAPIDTTGNPYTIEPNKPKQQHRRR